MKALGWFFILIGILAADTVRRGRTTHVGEDIPDFFFAIVNYDPDAIGEVLSRRGDDLAASKIDSELWDQRVEAAAAQGSAAIVDSASGSALLTMVETLGKAAKGYRWSATGPDYYDCSGLVWQACKKLGIYDGPRFTTATINLIKTFVKVADGGKVGDIVVWTGSHMGVVYGPDKMYSARSVKSGIGYSSISGHSKRAPIYLRVSLKKGS